MTVTYNRNHTCLVSSLFGVLVERLVPVVIRSLVKDQQAGKDQHFLLWRTENGPDPFLFCYGEGTEL
jgi:hypothetical protein